MAKVRVRIPFPYRLEFLTRRGKESRRITLTDTVEATLRVVSPEDAPIRIQVNDDHSRHDRRAFDGELYGSTLVGQGARVFPGTSQPLQHAFADVKLAVSTLFHRDDPFRIGLNAWRSVPMDPDDMGIVVWEDRAESSRRVVEAVKSLIVVDGQVFRKSVPPVLEMETAPLGEEFCCQDGSRRFPGYRFALDNSVAMDRVIASINERGKRGAKSMGIRIDRLDWDLSSEGEVDNNVRCAIHRVHQALGGCLSHLDSGILVLAAQLAKHRDNPIPGSTPATVHGLMRDLQDMLLRKEAGPLRLHYQLAMGLDMIEASRDYDRSPLDEEDVAVMDTLGHLAP